MKKILIILTALLCIATTQAQNKKGSAKGKASTTTVARKGNAKGKASANNKTQKTKTQTKNTKNKGKGKQANEYTNADIKNLQKQRADVQKKLKEHERMLQANKADVKQRMANLITINSEISEQQKTITGIEQDISHLDGNIDLLKAQLNTLEKQLEQHRERYVKSMRYMARNRNIQDRMMFIFSAKDFAQMYRRIRFIREYAAYQRAQGEEVKAKQEQIAAKHKELASVRQKKNVLLSKGKKAQATLQEKQDEQQKMVNNLKSQQKTIQGIIDDQHKKDAALNAEIDRLIAIEVAKAKARAEEEARKKAAEAAEAKKRRAEELRKKKAAAEAAERENERRIAEAKKREDKAKEEARRAARRDEAAKKKAEREALQAEADRKAAERKADADRRRHEKDVAESAKKNEEALTMSSVDRKLSNNFESNRGRLPMPITGPYRVVSHYGQYNVEGLKNVTLYNKGISIRGQAGAQARAIFSGEVSAVFNFDGSSVVMVRHGSYISVYCNLKSVSVHRGQHVDTRQTLGTIGSDNILQFQLRRETKKLNPEVWLGR